VNDLRFVSFLASVYADSPFMFLVLVLILSVGIYRIGHFLLEGKR
jgi:hypothetical protein